MAQQAARSWSFFKSAERGFAVVGLLTAGSATALSFSVAKLKKQTTQLPEEFVLELDLESTPIVEKPDTSPFSVGPKPLASHAVVRALKEAAKDERVKGLQAVLGAGGTGRGLGGVQEIRDAVARFRLVAGGRAPTAAYADSFGEMTNATATYYLATAFDKIYMCPAGLLGTVGLQASPPFLRGLLDKWKIKPIFFAREEYKNAANMFTHSDYSDAHREATTSLLDGLMKQMVSGISAARGLPEKAVRSAVNESPLACERAVELGFIDEALYRDQVRKLWAPTLPKEASPPPGARKPKLPADGMERIAVSRYLAAVDAVAAKKSKEELITQLSNMMPAMPWNSEDDSETKTDKSKKPTVAMVVAAGPIGSGKAKPASGSSPTIASASLGQLLDTLRSRKDVQAVVLRLDTGGGGAVASDAIHRAVSQLRAAGKPVVVSMADVCASGGYYIASAADKIVAHPGTLTGSIGVVVGKFDAQDALAEAGVGFGSDPPSTGKNAGLLSPTDGLTEAQEEKVTELVDGVYNLFLRRVADGRGWSMETVRKLAKGRVWTGEQAAAAGLVDELGGIETSVRLAKHMANLEDEEVEVEVYPRPVKRVEALIKALRTGELPDDMGVSTHAGSPTQAAIGLLSLATLGLMATPMMQQTMLTNASLATADLAAGVAPKSGILFSHDADAILSVMSSC